MILNNIFYYLYNLSNQFIIIINYIKNIYYAYNEKKFKIKIINPENIELNDINVEEKINNYCFICNRLIDSELFMILDKPFCSNYCRNIFSKNNLII